MKSINLDNNRVGEFVSAILGRKWLPGEATCIGLEQDGDLIAGVMYFEFNKANVFMSVAGVGKGWLNREFLWFSFYYPFEQLKVNRVTALISSDNKRSLDFCYHLGFIHEATLKNASPNGDLLLLSMTKNNCRFLRMKNVHKMAA